MRDNLELRVSSDRLSLIPYRVEHVETYHEWMKDPYILEMTASEPLSIEEEYEMQKSWAEDPKKLTFIVVLVDRSGRDDEMIGDVNLFFNDDENPANAEIDVMIARKSLRGKGYGTDAVLLMLHYAIKRLEVERFYCKINEKNDASLKMFKKLQFTETTYVPAFKEYELELEIKSKEQSIESIENKIGTVSYCQYLPPSSTL